MYFSPCSFALFRFSSRSARESFQCFKKPHLTIFFIILFLSKFRFAENCFFRWHSLILCASASSKIGFDNRSTSFHLRRFLLFELSPKVYLSQMRHQCVTNVATKFVAKPLRKCLVSKSRQFCIIK